MAVKPPFDLTTIPETFDRVAQAYPDKPAVIYLGTPFTYTRLQDMTDRFAAGLRTMGIGPGSRVVLYLPNCVQWVVAWLGIQKAGAVAVPITFIYTPYDVQYIANDTDAEAVVCTDRNYGYVTQILEHTRVKKIIVSNMADILPAYKRWFGWAFDKIPKGTVGKDDNTVLLTDLIKNAPSKPEPIKASPDDLCEILYTGGTTGVSKGVMLTHGNLSINVQQFKALLYDMEEGNERVLGILPFFHSAGFTAGMNTCIYRGFTDVLVPKPDLDIFIKMIKKHRPSIFGGVPTMYVGLLNHPKLPPKPELSFIKGSVSGAAPLAMETLKHWEDRVGAQIIEVFGMTEMSPISHANPWGGKTKAGSVGIPFPDTDCRVVDVETGEMDMPPGEAGEIILKGPQQMQGYYKRPDETQDSIRDGWFYTGDIGYMDEDGYLFVVDRKKDMIIAGGFNIYPRDIDEILYEHPKILEACTIGLPDAYRGETVKAFVVLQPGQTMTEKEVTDYCREKLAAYKVPKMVEFTDDLPKSAIGKVLRRELKEKELAKKEKEVITYWRTELDTLIKRRHQDLASLLTDLKALMARMDKRTSVL